MQVQHLTSAEFADWHVAPPVQIGSLFAGEWETCLRWIGLQASHGQGSVLAKFPTLPSPPAVWKEGDADVTLIVVTRQLPTWLLLELSLRLRLQSLDL